MANENASFADAREAQRRSVDARLRNRAERDKERDELEATIATFWPAIMARLYQIATDPHPRSAMAQVSAATYIIDRGFGQPSQRVETVRYDAIDAEYERLVKEGTG